MRASILLALVGCMPVKPPVLPLCDIPTMVIASSDVGEDVDLAISRGVDRWNSQVDVRLMVYGGVADFTSEEAPMTSMIVFRLGEALTPDMLAVTRQQQRGGCARGALITLVKDRLECEARLNYVVQHELGHAIGLEHKLLGLMHGVVESCAKGITPREPLPSDVEKLEEMY